MERSLLLNDLEAMFHRAYPELLQRVDGGDGVFREEVVQQRQRAQRVRDALEHASAELLDDVSLQVQRGQGVEVPEGARLHVPMIGFEIWAF